MTKISHEKLFQKCETYGLLFALTLHIIIANMFIFTIPVRAVAHKPFFIYLGAFLENIQSIDPLYVSQKNQSISEAVPVPATRQTIYTRYLNGDVPFNPQQNPAFPPRKPFRIQKTTLKETFLKDTQPTEQKLDKETLKRLQINPDLPPYKPLRMQGQP